jgi:hypothetical protein
MPAGLPYAVRVYYDSYTAGQQATWPAAWPARSGARCTLLTERPLPGPLLAGKYDAYYRALFASAPVCSDFSIWHENANGAPGCLVGLCNPLGYPASVRSPARFRQMQAHMLALTRGTHVKFGTIGCGPVASNPEWYAPHLDWYATDLYFNAKYLAHGAMHVQVSPFATATGSVSKAKVWARLSSNYAQFRTISGQRCPLYNIPESNASPDSRRTSWFADVAAWYDTHACHRTGWIITFWRAGKSSQQGGLSGPWPPSAGVLAALRAIVRSHVTRSR